ncbi:MAG: Rrf2 family transcriptional regulator [Acidimicrobiia bacterium]|nr:Rrf2 family transcriptional regulator [Acidimicrobiia bacterium]
MKLELLPRTDLAVQAVRHLATCRRCTSAQLAEALGTTPGYMTQVLRPLVELGMLTSARGPNGGYELDPTAEPSFLEVIEAIEGPTEDGRCVLKDSRCDASQPCALHDAWSAARSALLAELQGVPVLGD